MGYLEDYIRRKKIGEMLLNYSIRADFPTEVVLKIISKMKEEQTKEAKEVFLRRCYRYSICKDCGADTVTKWIPTHPYDKKIPFLQRRKSGQKYERKFGGEKAVEVCPKCGSELTRDDF